MVAFDSSDAAQCYQPESPKRSCSQMVESWPMIFQFSRDFIINCVFAPHPALIFCGFR